MSDTRILGRTPPTEATRPRTRRPGHGAGSERQSSRNALGVAIVGAAAIAAGVVAAFRDVSPAGVLAVDLLLAAVFAAGATAAAVRSRPWTWVWFAGLAALAGASGPLGAALAFGGLLMSAVVAAVADRVDRASLAGAAATALACLGLLASSSRSSAWINVALVSAGLLPLLWSAARHVDPAERPVVGRVVVVGMAAVGLVLAIAATGLLIAVNGVDRATDHAEAGLEAVRDGDQVNAVAELEAARVAFDRADRQLSAPWMLPARLLPVAGPNIDALDDASRAGASLSDQARATAEVVTIGDLTLSGGGIDLALLAKVTPNLEETTAAVGRARAVLRDADSPWLVGPLDESLSRLQLQLEESDREATLAVELARLAPQLAGGHGLRRYLVMIGSPAEARELGGFMGNYLELEADGGQLRLAETGRTSTGLNPAAEAAALPIANATELPSRFVQYRPNVRWQNMTGTPDFPTVARTAGSMYVQITGRPLNGVLYLDPVALGAFLKLTGPVQVEGLGRPLNAQNASRFLLRDQYAEIPEKAERTDFLAEAARATFDKLTAATLPAPREVARILGPPAAEGRLLVHSFDADEQALFEEMGLAGSFRASTTDDFLSVVQSNAGPNKIDSYSRRSITYNASVDSRTGSIEATVTVRLHNDAPAEGLPAYVVGNATGLPTGTARTVLSIYTPHDLREARIDGVPVGMERQSEFGAERYSTIVTVPPGGSVEMRLDLRGAFEPAQAYRLQLASQALANPDEVTVEVTGPGRDRSRLLRAELTTAGEDHLLESDR